MKFFLAYFLIPMSYLFSLQEWAVVQIEEDLGPHYGKRIQEKDIRQLFETMPEIMSKLGMVHVKIRKNQFSYFHNLERSGFVGRLKIYQDYFDKLARKTSLPDLDFIMHMHDFLDKEKEFFLGFNDEEIEKMFPVEVLIRNNQKRIPIFGFAAKKNHPNFILIPDPEIIIHEGYPMPPEVSWSEKKEKLFWVGSATGGRYTMNNWHIFPRVQLVVLSKSHPEKIEAWFSQITQWDQQVVEQIKYEQLTGPFMNKKDQLQYKYLIEVDGNSAGCSRIAWILQSNSLLFKHQSDHMQWYYNALKPWKHFIPVCSDFSDITAQIEWAINNDKQAQKIAKQATSLVEDIFCKEHLSEYMAQLLKEYAEKCCEK